MTLLHAHAGGAIAFDGVRIPRQVFSALSDCDAALEAAHDAASRLREQAAGGIAAEREAARREGYEAGREAGLASVIAVADWQQRVAERMTDRLADLVEQTLRAVLGQLDPAVVQRARLLQLLAAARTAQGSAAVLNVHPAQLHQLQSVLAQAALQAQATGATLPAYELRADDRCERDVFVLETPSAFIESRVELPLSRVRSLIFAAVEQTVGAAASQVSAPEVSAPQAATAGEGPC
jgi:flagellar biosynthesis/type III secretory pathway protein FliH